MEMSLDEMRAFWAKFDRVVAVHAPDLFEQMAPPAGKDDIVATERALGFALPPHP
jgi:cell wall assembly regulator SMI1